MFPTLAQGTELILSFAELMFLRQAPEQACGIRQRGALVYQYVQWLRMSR